ncbi:MAG: DUF1501 domain-containing protein [Dehalococcoidia bacterium]|nr:MAG: DUF1501 domain-containing protein [Dehalococcoidia bacterium]
MPDETFRDRPIDRRSFIKGGMAFVSAAAMTPPAFLRATFDDNSIPIARTTGTPAARRRILVVLQMAGGNDGLNTVIPLEDRGYFEARPKLAHNPESALPLASGLALSQVMTEMKRLWDEQRMAIVLGAGYPNPNRSHFRAMDIWHTASTDHTQGSGWLGRLMDVTTHADDSAWRAANVGNELPRSLFGDSVFVPSLASIPAYVLSTDRKFPKDSDQRLQTFAQLNARYAGDAAVQAEYGGSLAFVSQTGLEAYQSTVMLQADASSYEPRAVYPTTPIAQAFKTAAALIMSRLGTGVAYITTGGFDTHSSQVVGQARLLQAVSDAVGAFYADLAAHQAAEDVATVMWTEFGRRVKENASGGTDHGTATPMFVIGGGVRPGLYGDQPPTTSTDSNGDLKYTTDFRSVYASIIEQRFGVEAKDVLGLAYPTLPLFA